MPPPRVFLLSPAHCGGPRAQLLFNGSASFDLARRLHSGEGPTVTIGEVFSFVSGLYFRGKVAYAARFAQPPEGLAGALVITSDRGLVPADAPVTLAELRAAGAVPIDAAEPRYRAPLARDAAALARRLGDAGEAVLLGSVATGKYVDVLAEALGHRLRFPLDFVGRGDMSRGALMLRAARQGTELAYVAAATAPRHGVRPPSLRQDRGGRRDPSGAAML